MTKPRGVSHRFEALVDPFAFPYKSPADPGDGDNGMPLREDDHRILHRLNNELLDWIVAGESVRRQWFVRLATIQAYGGEIASLLAGLGIGAPLVAYLKGSATGGGDALEILRKVVPPQFFGVGIVAIVIWGALRAVAVREDVAARALFARDFGRAMQTQYLNLLEALRGSDPLPKLAAIQQAVDRKVLEASDKGILGWDKLPPAKDPARELEKGRRIDHIRSVYAANWAPWP